MNIFDYKAVFFDLDGTLIDSAGDLGFALNAMSNELSVKYPGIDNVKKWIGSGTYEFVKSSLTHSYKKKPSKNDIDKGYEIFKSIYSQCIGEHSDLYPDVKPLLVKLLSCNIKIACITNKPKEFSEFLLLQNMIFQFFSVIFTSQNSKYKKPKPWALLESSKIFELDIKQCLMIGDSDQDIQAARNAGCDVIGVSYGYNQGKKINQSEPDKVIDSFTELLT